MSGRINTKTVPTQISMIYYFLFSVYYFVCCSNYTSLCTVVTTEEPVASIPQNLKYGILVYIQEDTMALDTTVENIIEQYWGQEGESLRENTIKGIIE